MGASGAGDLKALAAELAPHGIALLDAPVCGTPADAKAGKLIIPVGGDSEIIDRLMPMFGALGPALGETLRRRVLTRSFDSGHTLDTIVRGLDIALGIARDAGISARFTALCQELWAAAQRDLGSEEDYTAVTRWLEATAQTPTAERSTGS